jgi:hypothetical protein
LVVGAAIDASHWVLRACTGSFEMSVFQMLSAGKTWQLVVGGAAAATGMAADRVAATTATSRRKVRAIVVAMRLE